MEQNQLYCAFFYIYPSPEILSSSLSTLPTKERTEKPLFDYEKLLYVISNGIMDKSPKVFKYYY